MTTNAAHITLDGNTRFKVSYGAMRALRKVLAATEQKAEELGWLVP